MDAVISDIHGNLEALDAVLKAIRELGANRIVCLGDIVCYGPDSLECLRLSQEWDLVVCGDWDQAMLFHDPTEWDPVSNAHISFIRDQIHSAADSGTLLKILRSYHDSIDENHYTLSHGTPNNLREWIFPEDVYSIDKLNRIAESFDSALFCGHSHLPFMLQLNAEKEWTYTRPIATRRYELKPSLKTIFTVGSVGQPRDGDPRASFVTLDQDLVQFHRVEYDLEQTIRKIQADPNINNIHGERLRVGR